MLFCILYVVNPITTGPKSKKPIDILSRLFQKPNPNTFLRKTVNLLSPFKQFGSINIINPTKNANGAIMMQEQAPDRVYPGATLARQGMICRYMAIISAAPAKCRHICNLAFFLIVFAILFYIWLLLSCFSDPS